MPVWIEQQLNLECFPKVPEHIGLPWNQADNYLIHYHKEQNLAAEQTLVINDRQGALACSLKDCTSLIDSHCAKVALEINTTQNNPSPIKVITDLADLKQNPELTIQTVLIALPKSYDLLEYWLSSLAQHLPEATLVIAGMSKHFPIAWLNSLEAKADKYQQLPIAKKARLVSIKGLQAFSHKSSSFWQGYQLPSRTGKSIQVKGLPGVFSRNKLDQGTEVLLKHLPDDISGTLCDLGCGNGVISLHIAQNYPDTQVIATDDSLLAVQSARENAKTNGLKLDVRQGHSLSAVSQELDWVICNPPFHDGHKELTNIATDMFHDAHKLLKRGGKLVVVANRNLPYHSRLLALFTHVESPSKDRRFTIYICTK